MTVEPVVIRTLTSAADCQLCVDLQRAVWHMPDVEVIPVPVMLAAIKSGGLMQGAFVRVKLAGFTMAIAGLDAGRPYLYSHALGVHPDFRRLHLGVRLKWAQARAARARGLSRIAWTYDPLQVPNANLNLTRLGAIGRTYLPDLYSALDDGLNRGLPTDRLLVHWDLDQPTVAAVLAGLDDHEAAGRIPDGGIGPPDPAGALDLDQALDRGSTAVPGTGVPGAAAVTAALDAAAPGVWARCRIPGQVANRKDGDPATDLQVRLRLRLLLGTALGRGWAAWAFQPVADGGQYWLQKESGGQARAH